MCIWLRSLRAACNACCCVPGVGSALLDNLQLFTGGDAWGAGMDDDDSNNSATVHSHGVAPGQ